MFSIDQLALVEKKAVAFIMAERETLKPVYDKIEEYVSNYHLIVGGNLGANLLLKKPRSLDDFVYELYCQKAFLHANNLTNELAGLGIVILKNPLPKQRYQIQVNNRLLVHVIELGEASPLLIIEPLKVESHYQYPVLIFSPEIQLLSLYRDLYSPQKASRWEAGLADEHLIFQQISLVKKEKVELLVWGSEDRSGYERQLLEKWIMNNPHLALVGDYAIYTYNPHFTLRYQNIQVISIDPEGDVQKLRKLFPQTPITAKTSSVPVLQDFRLTRTAVRFDDKEILYIYNSAAYDLIPVNLKTNSSSNWLPLGHPLVILRFLLLDFWIIRWISSIGKLDSRFAKEKLEVLREKLINFRLLWDKLPLPQEFLGSYQNEEISRKEKMNEVVHYPDYCPQIYLRTHGHYRQI